MGTHLKHVLAAGLLMLVTAATTHSVQAQGVLQTDNGQAGAPVIMQRGLVVQSAPNVLEGSVKQGHKRRMLWGRTSDKPRNRAANVSRPRFDDSLLGKTIQIRPGGVFAY